MHEGGRKAVIAALLANAGIAIVKFAAFGLTRSASMLAEAIHSCADTGNQALLLLGGSRAKRAPSDQHPFGYGRERFFWAFVVAMVLFSVGSLFALYEGIHKLADPHHIDNIEIAFGVLVIAILLESFSFRTAVIEASKVRGDKSWWQFIRQTKNPELATVLLEDVGALLGLVFALIGVSLAEITHNPRWDAVGSIAIGLLLGVIAVILARENKSLLIGESADALEVAKIREAIESRVSTRRLIHVRTLQMGPEELLVAAKVEFDPSLDQIALASAIDETESRIRTSVPTAKLIFLEPDEYREPSA